MSLELVVDNTKNPYYGKSKEPRKVNLDWLYKKFRGVCWICRRFVPRDQASRDHIVPESLGGGHEKSNIALAHKKCNSRRGNGFREIFFKHYESIEEVKDIFILDETGLYVQVWQDARDKGVSVIVAKKVREIP